MKYVITMLILFCAIVLFVCCFEPNKHDMPSGDETTGMTIEEAMEIAGNSECVQVGELTNNYMYNNYSKTFWIDLDLFEEKELCNPACVVYEETRNATINWRCRGLIEP